MSNKLAFTWPKYPILYVTAYFALLAVAVVELPDRSDDTFWPIAGLLLVFGGLMVAKPLFKVFTWQSHLYLALQAVVITSMLLLGHGALMISMLFCVSSMMAPLSLPLRPAALWIVAFVSINTLYCGTSNKWENDGWMVSVPYAVGYIFCGASAYSLARTSAAQHRSEALLAELQTAHQQLQAYATHVEELAVSQERNRLAREMHDALGHRLTVAAVQLEGAERLIPTSPARASQMVNTVHEQVVEALAELRRTVATLRTPLDVDLSLPRALTRLTSDFEEATGIKVNRSLPDELPPLPDAMRLAFYRAAQEALTNVQRHAHAQQVWLELTGENGTMTLLVKDDGQGFTVDTCPAGFGLRGLRERATHLNGAFHIESSPGEGTQICFHLPLPQVDDLPQPVIAPKSYSWKLMCPFGLHPLKSDDPARQPQSSQI
jgi:signal transduction histidine kinase